MFSELSHHVRFQIQEQGQCATFLQPKCAIWEIRLNIYAMLLNLVISSNGTF